VTTSVARRPWPERDVPARGALLRRDQHRPHALRHAGRAGDLADRCGEIGRDPATLLVSVGINPRGAWVRVTGRQRMMEQADVPSIMPAATAAAGSRTAELAAWRDMGIRRIVVGAPGMADTDEALGELVEDSARQAELTPPAADRRPSAQATHRDDPAPRHARPDVTNRSPRAVGRAELAERTTATHRGRPARRGAGRCSLRSRRRTRPVRQLHPERPRSAADLSEPTGDRAASRWL
jgi:hypothetical protein